MCIRDRVCSALENFRNAARGRRTRAPGARNYSADASGLSEQRRWLPFISGGSGRSRTVRSGKSAIRALQRAIHSRQARRRRPPKELHSDRACGKFRLYEFLYGRKRRTSGHERESRCDGTRSSDQAGTVRAFCCTSPRGKLEVISIVMEKCIARGKCSILLAAALLAAPAFAGELGAVSCTSLSLCPCLDVATTPVSVQQRSMQGMSQTTAQMTMSMPNMNMASPTTFIEEILAHSTAGTTAEPNSTPHDMLLSLIHI